MFHKGKSYLPIIRGKKKSIIFPTIYQLYINANILILPDKRLRLVLRKFKERKTLTKIISLTFHCFEIVNATVTNHDFGLCKNCSISFHEDNQNHVWLGQVAVYLSSLKQISDLWILSLIKYHLTIVFLFFWLTFTCSLFVST